MSAGVQAARRTFAVLCVLVAASCAPTRIAPTSADALNAIESELAADIAVLAGDDFEGRRPGTPGEAKTLRYLAQAWQAAGLESGTNDPAHPWFAPVALQLNTPDRSVAHFYRGRREIAVPDGSVLLYTSGRRSLLERSPVVFVGRAGEDLDQSELVGRIAVMLWDHPRKIEQHEALLDKGAAAVLAVVSDEAELRELIDRRGKGSYRLLHDEGGARLDGLMSPAAAQALLGPDGFTSLSAAAATAGFRPQPTDLEARLEATSLQAEVRTHNLIARFPGTRPDAGAVLLMAHWDHFGHCAEGDRPAAICNGAVDNASGLALLGAVARRLAGQQGQLDRDVYFIATTAEEWGLLGARAFARDPALPLDTIVAAFNVDTVAIAPRGGPVAIVGHAMTALDDDVGRIIASTGREEGDHEYANRYVRRQDGWTLLQHDVPTLSVSAAFADRRALEAFMRERYHRAGDVADDQVELGGAAEDVLLHLALVRHFASIESYPGPEQ
ncbi:M28 family metallopeptidase [Pelagerythrobacter marensis]|uniref:Peptidase M28 n=1 Tax=Pelagerythrobacter marensis TaxID=543877 RepID=A0A0G3X626_9SPHN|nr:M28 family peptidase [Pelagerythrobacter marensis]AKM06657.1 Peptidase M28 [Pelagerythrobacter marensis]